jgi:hypothetical protein
VRPDRSGVRASRSRRRWPLVGGVLLILAVVATLGVAAWLRSPQLPLSPSCTATAGADSDPVTLGPGETRIAATIAAVAKRDGLPNSAVTVALAAAMQESKLRNLDYGDRDSVGVFQQRPSQGWGTSEQLKDPAYAAAAFYDRLSQVPNWERLSVTEAAQAVQRSAGPAAYARWEPRARVLARVLTGETAAGLSCRYGAPAGQSAATAVSSALTAEAGSPGLGATVDPGHGWMLASWLVANAYATGISTVSFDGQVWTAATGRWTPHAPKRSVVQFGMSPT